MRAVGRAGEAGTSRAIGRAGEAGTSRAIGVAVLGAGTVGSEVLRLLSEQAGELAARVGAPMELRGVAVRRPDRLRDLPVDPALFTKDAAALVTRPDVDVVVELVGGVELTRGWLLSALEAGKSVVTANKALLAEDAALLHDAAAVSGAHLYYEASVGAAIPLLRPLRESLAGDRVHRVLGIVNGTTNYILSRMDATGASFDEALEEATTLGYAEADPTGDVEGFDAAYKAAILASLAFHTTVTGDQVHREGITEITAADIASARATGATIKLLCVCERGEGGIAVRVHPAMVPRSHPLAGVGDAFNAVFVEAESAGSLMFYGRGAGGAPTASAVLGDLVTVARAIAEGRRGSAELRHAELPVLPMADTITRYHVSLDVADRPGVLAAVAAAFAERQVSIRTVRQEGMAGDASIVLVTHAARDGDLAATVEDLRHLDAVRSVRSVLRVEGGEL
jgi:homoserine dehydrogenase